jgi:hypothetical protein
MKSFGDRCGIIRLIIISLYIDLVLSETVFERRIPVDVGVYISTPWERRIFRLVSHWGNKSFPEGKIKFPQWETFVSSMGN